MRSTTIPAAFAVTVAGRPDVEALRSWATGRALTWAQYADAACRVAAGLHALGLRGASGWR